MRQRLGRGEIAAAWDLRNRLVALASGVGHRPVAQRLQALAGDVEDAGAVRPLLAHRLEVVLDTGQRVGDGVELLSIGHALAGDQLDLGVALDAGQVLGRLRQLDDAQRAADLVEQARHVGQLGVVPVGLHECHERLARVAEVGDRLAHDHFQHLARFAGQQVLVGLVLGQAQARDLVIERGVDVKQGAGHIEQRVFVGGALAGDDLVHRITLLLHHATCDAQPHHPEGVADPVQRLDLRTQLADVGLVGAQVQVQRVLDP
ncbi:MAG: hypothetical protein KY442_13165 [Proteobacteria bacterium]|nr:hypothetical protein [Pseudomonadota bacterium]